LDPLSPRDFDCKVRHVFGEEDKAHEVYVTEEFGNGGTVGKRPMCERA
jgi:hypothetical protein